MKAHAIATKEAQFRAVFSQGRAMRLKCLILATIRARPLYGICEKTRTLYVLVRYRIAGRMSR
jgi:hypothetical protein